MQLRRVNDVVSRYCSWIVVALLVVVSTATRAAEEWSYTVQPGDNLWNLTQRHLKGMEYVPRLQRLNKIHNPYVVPPGTQLRIPIAWTRYHSSASAKVIGVHGSALVKRPDRSETQAELGMQLTSGDEVISAEDSFVMIEFSDQSQLRVQENTRLLLKNMQILGDEGLIDTLIELHYGRAESSVPKRADKSSRFRIKTPSATSSVRGTEFRVGATEHRSTHSEVLTGLVEVEGKKRQIQVPAGYGTVVAGDSAPAQPVRLLAAPDVSATVRYYQRLPLVIKLEPVTGAQAYRAQIATDREFRNMWSEFTTTGLPFRDGDIPDGDYWLRIRAIDASAIEGKDAVMPFALNARPEVPFVIAPQPGGMAEPENQQFKWARQSEAAHYAVMISRDEQFTDGVYFNPEVMDNSLTLPNSLTPGHYFWRLFSVSASEGAGPMSDAMAFRVPYPAPMVGDPQMDETTMTFAWQAPEEGQSFHFQFARDREFAELLRDEVTTASRIDMPKPESGTYYLRTKTIEADGFQGPWGSTQTIDVPRGISPWFMFLMLLPLLVLL